MTTTPHDGPDSGSGTPGPIPAQPVVKIEIFGSTVSVNGVVIVHDGTQSLHHVAVHAAAERVAKVLGRPVRAQAIDAEGRATLVVHPDGHASDVELVETYDSEADAVAATAAAAPVVAPTSTNVPHPGAMPAGPPPASAPPSARPTAPPPGVRPSAPPPDPTVVLPAAAATGAMAAPAAMAAPTTTPPTRAPAGAPSGLAPKVVRMVAVAAALVAVIGTGVLLLTQRSGDDPKADTSSETTPDPSLAAASSEPAPTPTTPTTSAAPGAPVASVTPTGGVSSLRLTITTDTVPGSATVTVTPASGKAVKRTVSLDDSTTDVDLGNLAPGAASWRVVVKGAEPLTGDVTIQPEFVAPIPTPTAVPVVPVVPAAPAPAPADPATKAPKKPKQPSKPATKKPSKPSGGGSAFGKKGGGKDKFKDKGDKGTTRRP